MVDYIELILRWIFGLQMVFWGLNGFFRWKQVPPSAAAIDHFTAACLQSGFIMPTVKIFEVVFGTLLLANTATPLSLVMLAPIIFVITALHMLYNKRSWEVLVPIALPFWGLVGLHHESWRTLI